MNPKNTNPLQNPFANNTPAATTGGVNPTPGMNGMPMPDNLASAEDNLTSAGMAAGPSASANAGSAMGLDQIASDSNSPALPYIDEPLIPAAPVPGSIGSAISMPPADPAPANLAPAPQPAPTPAPTSDFGAAPAATPMNPMAPANPAGPLPDSTPTPPPAPYNPFAPTPTDADTPEASSTSTTPVAPTAPASPTSLGNLNATDDGVTSPTGAQAAPAPHPTPASAPTSDSAHAAPAVQPMPESANPTKSSFALNPLTIILGVVALGLLALSIVFFVLWNGEKKNLKPVYYPQVSGTTNSTLKSISCQRAETRENPTGTGTSIITLGFTNDELSAYTSNLSLDFTNEADAAAVRDADAAAIDSLFNLVNGSFSVAAAANGNNYAVNITSGDGDTVVASDARNVIYGTTEGDPSLALADVQAKYEADGYVCTEE